MERARPSCHVNGGAARLDRQRRGERAGHYNLRGESGMDWRDEERQGKWPRC